MWKLIIIAIIAFSVWKFYPTLSTINVNNIPNDAINSIKGEKTIFKVNETRDELNKEASKAMNN